ncbi:hypothetical protein CC86DRAFT_416823 [Ophiobolus disseminans]|uniref:Glycosyltransferase family 25 protein n=1 Tax=Ophiobolus disseminans TaxID=1469910 RepID=A0A6A7A1P2_9PLEO|nr:hypothetical protein CC86DRAFT_416823 [Ophiobolus disseminans]
MLRKRNLTVVLLITLVAFIVFYVRPLSSSHAPIALTPANSTLGFGTIIAVSHAKSPRRASLLWAANLTDLEIVIPEQTQWTEAELEDFRSKEHSVVSRGSALAWLGHLDALRWFLSTPHSTALILEDDTDFSLHIRRTQIPLLASSIRALLGNTSSSPGPNDPDYWAPTEEWDLLYPGHCDDLPSPERYLSHPHLTYPDPSTPPHHLLHPDTSHFLSTLNVPAHTRILHRAFWPFCTFAYGVNRRSTAKILAEFWKEKDGAVSAFDVQLLESCRDQRWKCWSVSPEVFHHGVWGSEIAHAEEVGGRLEEGIRPTVPERGTWNIQCGARGPGVWVSEEDGELREEVKAVVRGMIERGECPVDGRERGWRGCEYGECGAQS